MITPQTRLAQLGHYLRDHPRLLLISQSLMLCVYITLLLALSLPTLVNHVSVNHFAEYALILLWAVGWPIVMLSIPLLGRLWCGFFCPEGLLTQWASQHGLGLQIPRWMRKSGLNLSLFVGLIVLGQLVDVYYYPLSSLAILGGTSLAALLTGFIYGRDKRVWCRYLCPVNSVFGVLAKLSPWSFSVDRNAWQTAHPSNIKSINCPPLVAMRHMQSASECHLCGQCSGFKSAITLTARSREAEIIQYNRCDPWQSSLLLLSMLGLSLAAFVYRTSTWQHIFPLQQGYIQILASLTIISLIIGGFLFCGFSGLDRYLPQRTVNTYHHLVQALIPLASASLVLGLALNSVRILSAHHDVWWIPLSFIVGLLVANIWSGRLLWCLVRGRSKHWHYGLVSIAVLFISLFPFYLSWWCLLNAL